MEQVKIGKFIAELRKEKNMTQTNLADKLGVSFKTVSKWETGRGMPDLSLLKPLSEELDITLNELLSGERISKEDLPQKTEEVIMNTINYSKNKIEKNKRILKYTLLILLAIFIIFTVLTSRKMIILSSLQNKISEYAQSTNYYCKMIENGGEQITITESYIKDNSYILYFTNISESGIRKLINYSDGTKVNTYIESNGEKIALLNSNGLPSASAVVDYAYTGDSLWNFLKASIFSSIKSENINGRDCYYIDKIFSPNILIREGKSGAYIDKETGLTIRATNGTVSNNEGKTFDIVVDLEYKFDIVTDEDLKEPDITQYKIQENN